MIISPDLKLDGIAHGFFTRQGGHSTGLYESLNCGLGSGDDIETVKKNRATVESDLELQADHLVTPYQVHGAEVLHVMQPLAERPKVDALVTATPGLALGILTADCAPILFADAQARVIGAAHAGWKGALAGVHANTVAAMERLGAKRGNIVAVIGPTISQANYEVGPDFPEAFLAQDQSNVRFFRPSSKAGHSLFDLQGYLVRSLQAQGLGAVWNLRFCTYAEEEWFYSYRRATHRRETDYGRQISVIALKG